MFPTFNCIVCLDLSSIVCMSSMTYLRFVVIRRGQCTDLPACRAAHSNTLLSGSTEERRTALGPNFEPISSASHSGLQMKGQGMAADRTNAHQPFKQMRLADTDEMVESGGQGSKGADISPLHADGLRSQTAHLPTQSHLPRQT